MSVWITGDIHGNPVRLSTDSFYEQKEFSGNKDENIVIILGDFGLVWSRDGENKNEKYFEFLYIYAYNNNIKSKLYKILKIKEKEGFL